MLSFISFIAEDFDIVDGKLNLSTDSGIKSKFGKDKAFTPYKKKIENTDILVYSIYHAKTANSTDIMRAIKGADMSDPEMDLFLKRSAVYAARIIRSLGVDVIVTPKSSSPLTHSFVKEIQARTNLDVFVDSFVKNPDISKIEVDVDNPKMTPAIQKSMQRIIDRAKKTGTLSLTKFSPIHRKFVKNLFKVTDEKILSKIDGKKVLIVDDILTSGSTTKSISDILFANGAVSINGLTLFKSKK